MGDIVIEEVNYKAIIFSLINTAVLLSAITLAVYGFDHDSVRYWLSGTVISVIISFFLIGSVLKAIKIKKLLIITRDGIIDSSSISGVGYISYEDIKEFKIVTIYNKKAIAVIPKNMDSFITESNMVKRRFKKNLSSELFPVTIYVNRAKDIAPEDILSLLQKRLADVSSLEC